MKLKYIFTALSLMISLCLGTAEAQQSDGEKFARGLLNKKVSYYKGDISFTASTNNGSWQVNQEFTLIKDRYGRWVINKLSVNGSDIYIDPDRPLPSLPSYVAGDVTDYNLYLSGFDAEGNSVRYGYGHSQHLLPGDSIKIAIYPHSILKKVPFQVPPGVNPDNLMMQVGNDTGYYHNGNFYMYMDFRNTETEYDIIDRTRNVVIGSGNLGGGTATKGLSQTLDLSNEYGVQEIDLNVAGEYQYLPGQQANATLFRNGDKLGGNIYTVFTADKHQYLHVYAHNTKPGNQLEVWGYSEESDEFTLLTGGKSDSWGTIEASNNYGFDRYKVIVLDNGGAWTEYGFGLSVFTSSNRQMPSNAQ